MDTAFTRLVGCRHPIQQAGMGGTATPELAAAVAEAGAVGMLGIPGAAPDAVVAALDRVAGMTAGVFGVNFLMPFLNRSAVEAASGRARIVEFFYGDPDPSLVETVHQGGSLAAWQVGSRDEAAAAADAGCDLVVAQGVEAGGHVRGTVGLLPLLDAVLAAVTVPVVAAGGLGAASSVAAVLAAGAAGARIGTRFVAAEEADAHPDYVNALVAAGPDDTVLTTTFSNGWPDAPHRVLRSCVDEATNAAGEHVAELGLPDGGRMEVTRLSPMTAGRSVTGAVSSMALYAGQSVGAVTGRMPASAIVDELAGGAERLLRRWA